MKKIEKINLIVKKIVKFKSGYKVYCLDKNNKEIILNTKKLILAAGTVSTTRLVAQMLKYKKKIKIKHNPMIFGAFVAKENLKITKKLEPSDLAAVIKNSKSKYFSVVNFRTSNSIIKEKF